MKTVKLGKTEEESFCNFVAVVARGAGGWRKEWRRNRKIKKKGSVRLAGRLRGTAKEGDVRVWFLLGSGLGVSGYG